MADNSAQNASDTIRDLDRGNLGIKTQVTQIDIGGPSTNGEKLVTAGQSAMASSIPVVIASDQTKLPTTTSDGAGNPINSLSAGSGANGMLVAIGATNYQSSGLEAAGNSSVVQLAPGQVFIGQIESGFSEPAVSIIITCDQPGILTINQYSSSSPGTIAGSNSFLVPASTGGNCFNRSFTMNGNDINTTFKNVGAAATTTFAQNVAYGAILPVTQLLNLPCAINEVNGKVLSLGAQPSSMSLPVVLATDQAVIQVSEVNAALSHSSDFPEFTAITGDPSGDFANVDFMSALFDPSLGLSLSANIVNQPKQDSVGAILNSDAPSPIILSGKSVNQILVIDTQNYQTLQVGCNGFGASVFGSNDLINWTPLYGYVPAYAPLLTTAVSGTAQYIFPCTSRYIRFVVNTVGNGVAFLRSIAFVYPNVNLSAVSGTTVNNANAQFGVQIVSWGAAAGTGGTSIGGSLQANGCSIGVPVVMAGTPVSNTIKTTAGRLYSLTIANANTGSGCSLKLYNGVPTVGTTVPAYVLWIPPSGTFTMPISDVGLYFSTGIYFTVTGGILLLDTTAITANTVVTSYSYI